MAGGGDAARFHLITATSRASSTATITPTSADTAASVLPCSWSGASAGWGAEIWAGSIHHAFAAAPVDVDADHQQLTRRELEILRLVAAGASNGHIARQLWVTEQTIKFHLSNVYRKLGVANRTEASHYAHVHELIEPPRRLTAVSADQAA